MEYSCLPDVVLNEKCSLFDFRGAHSILTELCVVNFLQ